VLRLIKAMLKAGSSNGAKEDFNVRAPDGIDLRGWKIRPPSPNGDWVLLFHDLIEGVVAEDPFADLREVSYDYAGLHFIRRDAFSSGVDFRNRGTSKNWHGSCHRLPT
jgi:hypothetical protein